MHSQKVNKTLKSLDRYARIAAHTAIQKSPSGLRALFKHTEEYCTRKMARLYDRAGPGQSAGGQTPEAYRDLLGRAAGLGRLTANQNSAVRKYAYSHFMQRQVPLEVVHDPHSDWLALQHEKRDLLAPVNDPFIEFICDRLTDGHDFNMDETLVAQSGREVSSEMTKPQPEVRPATRNSAC